MGVELPADIGEWVCDGVILCEVINKLHPGLITKSITKPSPGEVCTAIQWQLHVHEQVHVHACDDSCVM